MKIFVQAGAAFRGGALPVSDAAPFGDFPALLPDLRGDFMHSKGDAVMLASVRRRLQEARHLLAMAGLDAERGDVVDRLIQMADLAVGDCLPPPAPPGGE